MLSGSIYARLYNRVFASVGVTAGPADETTAHRGDEDPSLVSARRFGRHSEDDSGDTLSLDGDELDLGSDVLRLD